ncbi:MAG TPA: ATP-binding protein [Planctomycetota bacterium]|nr:ATP-binding protein [Planctomycetota bacterium]
MLLATREESVEALLRSALDGQRRRLDRLFIRLFFVQWLFALMLAAATSPFTYSGAERSVHPHLWTAFLGGALLTLYPAWVLRRRPGGAFGRHVTSAAQICWSALLIHLTGGRIETHFHVFASLAFLAAYRDWTVLVTASMTAVVDHFVRGAWWPESVYGTPTPEWWRFLEHAAWVSFEDFILIWGVRRGVRDLRGIAEREIALEEARRNVEKQVDRRTAELATANERYRALLEATAAVPWAWEPATGRCVFIGRQVEALFGWPHERFAGEGFLLHCVHPDDRATVSEALSGTAAAAGAAADSAVEYRFRKADGTFAHVRTLFNRADSETEGALVRGVTVDLTAQKHLERELRQAQKLESVGRLAAGVAHEINTPIQFVADSVHFIRDAVGEFLKLFADYEGLRAAAATTPPLEARAAALVDAREAADFDYLAENVPKALERSTDGLRRVAVIVSSMKEFSHQDGAEAEPADLNKALQSTLTIARHEYKYVADVETDFGAIPPVECLAGEINQAFLNIVVNAAHAIGDVVKQGGAKGRITVSTRLEGDEVEILVSDTGGGIPEHVRERVFDPFFTTKEVGKGTGQGLPIALQAVKDKHGGSLTFDTEVGRGTTFRIRLPVRFRGPRAAEPVK